MSSELIIALDFPTSQEACALVDGMPEDVTWFKVGLELFCAEGPDVLQTLRKRRGMGLFLDLKLHDIPNTVARAVRSAARHGVNMLTVHASGGKEMLRAAADAARELGPTSPRLIAVTTLTSLSQQDLVEQGIQQSMRDRALALGDMAMNSGMDGLVASVDEVKALRAAFGDRAVIVTPGIRLPSQNLADQKRIATPSRAVRAGSDFLVVGRPITEAENPALAAQKILEDMRTA